MNKTLKKQAAPGCVNVHYITFHGRTVFAKDMASDLKQKLQKTKTKELQICKNKNCAYHAWGFPPLQLCRACSAKEVWLHHAFDCKARGESVCKRNILKICSRIFHRSEKNWARFLFRMFQNRHFPKPDSSLILHCSRNFIIFLLICFTARSLQESCGRVIIFLQ